MSPTGPEKQLDGVQLAVLANRFESVVRTMRNTLVRTARSGVINTAYDFSCCVLSRDNEFLAMAESLPIHLISGPDLMAKVIHELHPEHSFALTFAPSWPASRNCAERPQHLTSSNAKL